MFCEIHMQLVYSCAHTASGGIWSSIYTQVKVIAGSTWQSSTCRTHAWPGSVCFAEGGEGEGGV